MILTDVFKNIYIINIDIMTDKLEDTKKQLEYIGVSDYKRFSGVIIDGEPTLESRHLGCTTSHMDIIKEAKQLNLENVLILEDDVMFDIRTNDYLEYINTFITNEKWDLFYLGGNHEGLVEHVNDNIVKINKTKTTHAYAINNTCYDDIINWRIDFPVDDMYINIIQGRGDSYCIYPRLAIQRPGYSYINDGFRDATNVMIDNEFKMFKENNGL